MPTSALDPYPSVATRDAQHRTDLAPHVADTCQAAQRTRRWADGAVPRPWLRSADVRTPRPARTHAGEGQGAARQVRAVPPGASQGKAAGHAEEHAEVRPHVVSAAAPLMLPIGNHCHLCGPSRAACLCSLGRGEDHLRRGLGPDPTGRHGRCGYGLDPTANGRANRAALEIIAAASDGAKVPGAYAVEHGTHWHVRRTGTIGVIVHWERRGVPSRVRVDKRRLAGTCVGNRKALFVNTLRPTVTCGGCCC